MKRTKTQAIARARENVGNIYNYGSGRGEDGFRFFRVSLDGTAKISKRFSTFRECRLNRGYTLIHYSMIMMGHTVVDVKRAKRAFKEAAGTWTNFIK